MRLPEATAAAMRLEIGGKMREFSPLRIGDFGELGKFCQDTIIDLGRRAIKRIVMPQPLAKLDARTTPPGELAERALEIIVRDAEIAEVLVERDYIMDKAFDRAEAHTLASPSAMTLLGTPNVMPFVVWLSMRTRNSAMTLLDAETVCDEVDDAGELLKEIMRLSGQKSWAKSGGAETANPPAVTPAKTG